MAGASMAGDRLPVAVFLPPVDPVNAGLLRTVNSLTAAVGACARPNMNADGSLPCSARWFSFDSRSRVTPQIGCGHVPETSFEEDAREAEGAAGLSGSPSAAGRRPSRLVRDRTKPPPPAGVGGAVRTGAWRGRGH